MPTLHITRGLPASGKSTWARQWVAEDPAHRAEVNRDHLRLMMHGGFVNAETQITAARDGAVLALLQRGTSVVVSDTCLPQRHARGLAQLALKAGAEVEIVDLANVPLEVCIERDAAREAKVGEERIRDMWDRFIRGRAYPLPLPDDTANAATQADLYEAKPGTPKAVLVDIDGTVALMNGRSPYDESRVDEDGPNTRVIDVVKALARDGHYIVFMSGRTAGCMDATADWLDRQGFGDYELHMRPVGDQRKDSIVKVELFDQHIRDRFNVTAVLDDRQQVVDAWRALGLTVLQVAEGNF